VQMCALTFLGTTMPPPPGHHSLPLTAGLTASVHAPWRPLSLPPPSTQPYHHGIIALQSVAHGHGCQWHLNIYIYPYT